MKKVESLLFLLSMILLPFSVHGGDSSPEFQILDIEDGLSQNMVNAIAQDAQGYMWFGTMDGLNRFDGYSIKSLYNDPADSSSLLDNWVTTIFNDGENLWIGAGGLHLYNPSQKRFHRFTLHQDATNKAYRTRITALIKDGEGYLWVGTEKFGLYRLKIAGSVENHSGRAKVYTSKPDTYTIVENVHYVHDANSQQSILKGKINALQIDDSNTIWIGGDNGLSYLELNKSSYQSPSSTALFKHIDKISINDETIDLSAVKSVYVDREQTIWAGIDAGLVRIERGGIDKLDFSFFPHQAGIYKLKWEGSISDIKEIENGFLWLATMDALAIFDKTTETYHYIKKDPTNQNSLIHNNILSLFKDNGGVVWLGTAGKGINKYNSKLKPFRNYLNHPSKQSSESVYALLKDKNQNIWVATNDFNLVKIDTKDETQRRIKIANKIQAIYDILEDHEGYIWFASAGQLYKYHPKDGKMDIFKPEPQMPIDPHDEIIYFLELENNHTIWALHHKMILAFNLRHGTFTYYPLPELDHNGIQSYAYDGNGQFWIGTSEGLYFIDVHQNQWEAYNLEDGDEASNEDLNILSILRDPDPLQNILWIGTDGNGFYRAEISSGNSLNYTTKDGLPNNVVYGILPDSLGNLWMSTNQGLSCFDPHNHQFKNYKVIDGIQSNEFNRSSYYAGPSGELLFGGINGITEFHPSEITANTYIPPIVFTEITLNHSSEAEEPIKTIIPSIDSDGTYKLKLKHNQNNISIEFAALSYAAPMKNEYAFMIEPLDIDWNYIGHEHKLFFSQLHPGNYTLKIKGTNDDGIWNERGIQLMIDIPPPITRSVWAFILYGLISIGILIFVFRHYLNHIRLKEQIRFRNLETKTLRELDQVKSRFFANISHEFRTPLSLIKAPLHDLMKQPELSSHNSTLKRISRNVTQLLNLINQLLDISKLESNKMTVNPVNGNIVQFISMLVDTYYSIGKEKEIDIEIVTEEDLISTYFDPDVVQKILSNLISNAIKFIEPEGRIKIGITKAILAADTDRYNDNNYWLQISVIDNGPGIAAAELSKIFNRFYQTSKPKRHVFEGFGIGLSLVKELVEIHRGKIKASSIEGVGTTFILHLPIIQDADIAQCVFNTPVVKTGDNLVLEEYFGELEYYLEEEKKDELNQSSAAKGSDQMILVIEDHKGLSDYLAEVLKPWYQTIQAMNGEEGVKLAVENIPDLIITDIAMPKMNGIEVANFLKNNEETSHIPLIFLTAKVEDSDIISGLVTGADDYLLKPFKTEELLIRIKNLISIRQELRKKFRRILSLAPEEIKSESIDEQFMRKVLKVVDDRISDENFGVEVLAEEMNLSPSQLYRKIMALTNFTTVQLIQNYRLDRAKNLIINRVGNISEIAYKTGFKSPSYFTKCFKNKFGKIPIEYMAG